MTDLLSRRNVVKTTVWALPAITVATAAPAFAATSDTTPCTAVGWFKAPGKGHNTKDYYVQVSCGSTEVTSVKIYDDVKKKWRTASELADGIWKAVGFNDSRRTRKVLINGTQTLTVSFSPIKD